MFRGAVRGDLAQILKIYARAREFMAENGNPTQWGTSYPERDMLVGDIRRGESYVMLDGRRIVGTFAFIIGPDPTYRVIEDGAWHYDDPYGTIHRLASDGSVKGIAKACFDYSRQKYPYLRIDTHEDNLPMQKAILRYGFQKCGTIYLSDGAPRIAFDNAAASD